MNQPVDGFVSQFYYDPTSPLCVQCQRVNFGIKDRKQLIECPHLAIPSARAFKRKEVPTEPHPPREEMKDDGAANNQSLA